MKKLFLCLCILFSQGTWVFAQNDYLSPYQLSTNLPQDEVSAQDCIFYIQKGKMLEAGQLATEKNDELRASLLFYYDEYFRLNNLIIQLEVGEENSLLYGENQLNIVYDRILSLLSDDDDFLMLDEEEQMTYIQSFPEVIEWESYINQIQETIHKTVLERDKVEGEYLRLSYDLENVTSIEAAENDDDGLLNQCLLLPYSVDYYPQGSFILESQNKNLAELLLSLDSVLKKLVPNAYQKISFQQIYDIFNESYGENIEVSSKFPEVFDMNSLAVYEFKKDLNINNLKKMASQANSDIQNLAENTSYHEIYRAILQTKEEQYRYFSTINQDVWLEIKQMLADYLNEHQLFKEEDIAQIKQLHDRYQVKLVLFDEIGQMWQPIEDHRSGYLEKYYHRAFESGLQNNEVENLKTNREEKEQTFLSDYTQEEDKESEKIDEKLSKLKSNLGPKSSKNNSKDLAAKTENKNKDQVNTKDSKNSPVKLPSTGEQWTLTIIAVSLLFLGILLLLYHRKLKRKDKQLVDDIDLI